MFLLKKAKSRPVPHSSALAERRGMRLGMSGFIETRPTFTNHARSLLRAVRVFFSCREKPIPLLLGSGTKSILMKCQSVRKNFDTLIL